ncbi:23S rRNA (adenine2030-N6)-methyltransferase [Formivibrio citricus]|uniref:Ribosomal RNA large subunit methyltransferase J n=1 Tax=Formivibrio citricus TaxID=83765 RepID=A0A1I4X9D0_9NEIS|nr:23S rRNA (adenine(2030)-N(6))-methyltransferase RlmJ [Formivibrio citricus]SFN21950.1 23S rRNA (adenine2030-N6)-methyltransferase [Formivibrio citricus]
MLSYRHAFHAGNHADVLKHCIELSLLDYLNQKDKPWWYVDTHAGAGCYELTKGYAAKNAEYETGIARLWERKDLPPALGRYVELVRSFNPDGKLHFYPGSPLVALQTLREEDRLRLFELHPSDHTLLAENFAEARKKTIIQQTDGFAGLRSVLPPPPRRALVLIDPPFEDKSDYRTVITALQDALKRFATGIYAVWFPHLQRREIAELTAALKTLPCKSWLHAGLNVQTPSADGFGMHGSSMFILNPPWTLHQALQEVLPYLVESLGQDKGAGYVLEQVEN